VSHETERVIGRIPALECLRAGKRRILRLHLAREGKGLDPIRHAARGILIVEHSQDELDRMSGNTGHQGVILEASPLPLWNLTEWLKQSFPQEAILVILDGIEDPHNFGAIIRTAVACGACGIVFAKDRAAPISPTAAKAAAGAMEYIDLIQVTNLARALKDLQQAGFWVAGLEAEAAQSVWEADLKGRIALVLGNEGQGLRRLTREHCDLHLCIPLPGPITTLNVSVSAAIALSECVRQRNQPK
jgi:23S rRNA (guanosine2251-2'-O)-methyltransferase